MTFKTFSDKKGVQAGIVLENVHLAYVQLNKPTLRFESETEYEFSALVITDEDTADEYEERFPKASVKGIKTADFEAKYKFAPPFPDEKKQYIIKVGSKAQGKDQKTGELYDMPYYWDTRPKVYYKEFSASKIKDITMNEDMQVGNGSVATAIKIAESGNNFGNFAYLRAILIEGENLVVREKMERKTHNPFEEWGEIDEDSVPSFDDKEATPPKEPESAPAPKKEPTPSFDEDFDDVPF